MKFLVVAVLMTSIAGTLGLECYTCTSVTGASSDTNACNDPFGTGVTTTNCTAGADVCLKSVATNGDLQAVSRACSASIACPEQNGCSSGSYGGLSATVCCCNGDRCNGAGSVTVNVVATAAVIFLAKLFTL